MTETRKLAAILAADVVGFSRLASVDEDRTLARLRALRSDLIDPTIAVHRGRVVKRTGDGAIVEFRSAVDAVGCAIEIQKAMVERNSGLPDDQRIVFRIGVHVGDVVEEADGDLMGDGVNIAARLESVGMPGAICLSEAAYWQVKSRLELKVKDLGAISLKNIAEPIRAYSLEVGAPAARKSAAAKPRIHKGWAVIGALVAVAVIAVAAGAWRLLDARGTALSSAPLLSIVALPFANLSGDPSQDYLADALTDQLTTYLSRLPDAFVIARNTAFTYKGKPTDAKEIGRDLGVRYVLQGSVQPTESRLRVNAQLTDVESGGNLWAESFDHDRADLLETEDDIVTRLARSLDLRFNEVEAARAGRMRPDDPTAQDLALRCQAAVDANRADAEKLTKYAPIFEPCEKALAIDPRNVLALGLVAARLSRMANIGESVDPAADLARSKDLSKRVIAIDPDGMAARGMKANLAYLEGRMQDALNETERAIAANPSDINAYFLHCAAANGAQKPQEAIEYADRAMRLSPRDPFLYRFYLQKGWALTSLGKYADALVWLDRSLSLAPNYTSALTIKIVALVNSGRDQEGHETYLRYAGLPGRHPNSIKETKALFDRLASAEVRNDPKYVAEQQRFLDSLHKAGMPDE